MDKVFQDFVYVDNIIIMTAKLYTDGSILRLNCNTVLYTEQI